MFSVTFTMEDTTVTAVQSSQRNMQTEAPLDKFHLTAIDALSGKTATATCTLDQLTAIFALGFGSVGENNTPGYWTDKLYDQIKGLFDDWPTDCRPVP